MATVKKLQPLRGKKPLTAKKAKAPIVLATDPHPTRLHKPKSIALHHAPKHAHPVSAKASKKTVW